jgi:hypothetical protein
MRRLTWFLALALACLGAHHARADVNYDNGTVNNLSTNLNDNAVVRDSATGQPTTLNFLGGGIVNDATVEGHSALILKQAVSGGTASAIRGT